MANSKLWVSGEAMIPGYIQEISTTPHRYYATFEMTDPVAQALESKGFLV
jgi:hypothetical protein